MMLLLIPLFAVISPFALWPIELFLPYPYIIEELVMVLLVLPALETNRIYQIKNAIIIGILFSISEGVLYMPNIFLVGDINTFFVRMLLTTSLHVLTPLIIVVSTFIGKRFIVGGFILAAAIHYFFNLTVSML